MALVGEDSASLATPISPRDETHPGKFLDSAVTIVAATGIVVVTFGWAAGLLRALLWLIWQ